jgi:hypothetical protein
LLVYKHSQNPCYKGFLEALTLAAAVEKTFKFIKKMKIKFQPQQYEYLKFHLSKQVPDLFEKFQASKISENRFDLNEDVMYLISEWAGEELQRVGFDKYYQATQEGNILESIIDLLYA